MANKGTIGVTTENIFPVIKKFLYSDHEIFLRELVANAVDATQKMKALASSGDFKGDASVYALISADHRIRLSTRTSGRLSVGPIDICIVGWTNDRYRAI